MDPTSREHQLAALEQVRKQLHRATAPHKPPQRDTDERLSPAGSGDEPVVDLSDPSPTTESLSRELDDLRAQVAELRATIATIHDLTRGALQPAPSPPTRQPEQSIGGVERATSTDERTRPGEDTSEPVD